MAEQRRDNIGRSIEANIPFATAECQFRPFHTFGHKSSQAFSGSVQRYAGYITLADHRSGTAAGTRREAEAAIAP
jgi:hypothetical protein